MKEEQKSKHLRFLSGRVLSILYFQSFLGPITHEEKNRFFLHWSCTEYLLHILKDGSNFCPLSSWPVVSPIAKWMTNHTLPFIGTKASEPSGDDGHTGPSAAASGRSMFSECGQAW